MLTIQFPLRDTHTCNRLKLSNALYRIARNTFSFFFSFSKERTEKIVAYAWSRIQSRKKRGDGSRAHTHPITSFDRVKSSSRRKRNETTTKMTVKNCRIIVLFRGERKEKKKKKETKDKNSVSRLLRPSCVLARTSTARCSSFSSSFVHYP